LGDVGNPYEYLAELAAERTPLSSHALSYAHIVRRMACARTLVTTLIAAAQDVLDNGDLNEVIGHTSQTLRAVSARQIGDEPGFPDVVRDEYENLGKNTGNYVPTRYTSIDKNLGGGLRRGDLITLAAATTQGKTTLGVNLGVLMAVNRAKVLILSAEMTARQI